MRWVARPALRQVGTPANLASLHELLNEMRSLTTTPTGGGALVTAMLKHRNAAGLPPLHCAIQVRACCKHPPLHAQVGLGFGPRIATCTHRSQLLPAPRTVGQQGRRRRHGLADCAAGRVPWQRRRDRRRPSARRSSCGAPQGAGGAAGAHQRRAGLCWLQRRGSQGSGAAGRRQRLQQAGADAADGRHQQW
jgi:hypothetical protein